MDRLAFAPDLLETEVNKVKGMGRKLVGQVADQDVSDPRLVFQARGQIHHVTHDSVGLVADAAHFASDFGCVDLAGIETNTHIQAETVDSLQFT